MMKALVLLIGFATVASVSYLVIGRPPVPVIESQWKAADSHGYSDDVWRYAALEVIQPRIPRISEFSTIKEIDVAVVKIAETRLWAETITDARMRREVLSWCDFYQKRATELGGDIKSGTREVREKERVARAKARDEKQALAEEVRDKFGPPMELPKPVVRGRTGPDSQLTVQVDAGTVFSSNVSGSSPVVIADSNDWEPIDTAPKDRQIWVFGKSQRGSWKWQGAIYWVYPGFSSEKAQWHGLPCFPSLDSSPGQECVVPTHWRELPPDPN